MKILLIGLAMTASVAQAATPFLSRDTAPNGVNYLVSDRYISVNGEYRICKNKPGRRTFVKQGMCLWEMPIAKDDLEAPNSVAGLKVEKAETESVDSFIDRELAKIDANVVSVEPQHDEMLLIYYQADRKNNLASR